MFTYETTQTSPKPAFDDEQLARSLAIREAASALESTTLAGSPWALIEIANYIADGTLPGDVALPDDEDGETA